MIDKVVDARRIAQGAVKAALAAPVGTEREPRTVGPFAVLVHVMPHAVEAGMLPPDADVRAHPHIGLAAVSYLLDGHVSHRDSLGSRREIGPGDLGVTIAGRGVVHSERFDRQRTLGGSMEMLQILTLVLPYAGTACSIGWRPRPSSRSTIYATALRSPSVPASRPSSAGAASARTSRISAGPDSGPVAVGAAPQPATSSARASDLDIGEQHSELTGG